MPVGPQAMRLTQIAGQENTKVRDVRDTRDVRAFPVFPNMRDVRGGEVLFISLNSLLNFLSGTVFRTIIEGGSEGVDHGLVCGHRTIFSNYKYTIRMKM